ncbi:hypothetical protein B0H66DRAFT_644749 [Apodospora peruviana]|uniref:Rhodopsin domain-containing protein n=1 Tax=Apodospora peruviana TaxID=516989 RepID=A0AAE0HU09_9PEZI|nr:hypothetical protein B0H66DRAFT_644749 [Apodospora peruviana]
MRLPPVEVMKTWPKANYDDPVTRGSALLVVECIALSSALICLALRLYVRIFLVRNTGIDDWIMVAAALFGVGVTVSAILASTYYGWDRHVWDLHTATMIQGRQISMATQALFVLSSSLAKVSILVSYLRLALRGSWFRRLCHGAIWLVIVSSSVFIIILFTQCTPISDYWNVLKKELHCIPEAPPLILQSVITVLTDFIVWVLPLPTLYMAKLPLSQRIALIILFSFGGFVVIAGCMRTYWIHYIIEETFDPTWQGMHLWIWTAVEVHLGVICGCVPWLKSLVKFSKKGGNTTTTGGTPGGRPSHYNRSGAGAGAVAGGTGVGGQGNVLSNPLKSSSANRKTAAAGGSGVDGLDTKWLHEMSDDPDDYGIEMDSGSYSGRSTHRTSSIVPIKPG